MLLSVSISQIIHAFDNLNDHEDSDSGIWLNGGLSEVVVVVCLGDELW